MVTEIGNPENEIAVGEIGWPCEAGVVVDFAPSDRYGNRMRIIACARCGERNSRPTRLTDLKKKGEKKTHTRSCSCWSRKTGKDNADAKVSHMSAETLSAVFATTKENGRYAAAGKFGIPAFLASRAMHLRQEQLRGMHGVIRKGVRAVALSSRRGVKNAMSTFSMNRAEVITITRQIKRETAATTPATPAKILEFPTPTSPAQETLTKLLKKAFSAWIEANDNSTDPLEWRGPHAHSTIRAGIDDMAVQIAALLEKVAAQALTVTGLAACDGLGEYGSNLNPREFATPGTVAEKKSRTALTWLWKLLQALPSDFVDTLGAQVNGLLHLMRRSLTFRRLKTDDVRARLRLGETLGAKSSSRPLDRIRISAPKKLSPFSAASVLRYAIVADATIAIAA